MNESKGQNIVGGAPPESTAAQDAGRAETFRIAGNYSNAITLFSKAIAAEAKKGHTYYWAHAHRGAARAALGDFHGACEDFRAVAGKSYTQGNSAAWLHAQMGELCRLWARAVLSTGPQRPRMDLQPEEYALLHPGADPPPREKVPDWLLEAAIYQLKKSLKVWDTNAWTHAHLGAVYTMRYWIGPVGNRFNSNATWTGTPTADFEDADHALQRACDCNPGYGWAFAFRGILYALRATGAWYPLTAEAQKESRDADKKHALELIGKALSSGLNRQLPIIRILMELDIYSDSIDSGVNEAWQALGMDTEDAFARYFVADGLSQRDQKHPDAVAARARARLALDDIRLRTVAMLGGLDCLDDNLPAARERLADLRIHHDLEALALVSRDPAWGPLRDDHAHEKGNPYWMLFDF